MGRRKSEGLSRQEVELVLAQLRREVTRDDSRYQRYTSPLGPTHGVTTVLKALNKEALVFWASKVQSDACETVALEWLQAEDGKRGDLLKTLQRVRQAHRQVSKRARDAGVEGHMLAECEFRRQLGQDVERPALEHPREANLVCSAILEWAKENSVQPIAAEQPVWSRYGYAGTMDLLADVRGTLAVVDWKSNDRAAIYRESYLQNMALRGALKEHGVDVPQGIVVVVPRDGQGDIRPVTMAWRERDLEAFLALCIVHRWAKDIDREIG